MEAAYTTMWELWQHGQSPRSFSIKVDSGVPATLPEQKSALHFEPRPVHRKD
jgi:hypothetical protein